jgi:hypothetical protein
MFDHRRSVLTAAGIGYLLCGFLLAVAAGLGYFVSQQDPYQLAHNWEQDIANKAANTPTLALGGIFLFVLAVAALIFFRALAARAKRVHPTSAELAALFLTAATLAVAVVAVWSGTVSPYTALQYQWAQDPTARQALLYQAPLTERVWMLGFWCFFGFGAVGLYFLGRALRGEKGWLPDVFRLSAALLVLHLPIGIYLTRESLLRDHYVRWLAVLDQFMVWGGLAVAVYFGARWLRHLGRSLAG